MENKNGKKIEQIRRLTTLIVENLEMAEEENVSDSRKSSFKINAFRYYDTMGEVLCKGYIGKKEDCSDLEDITAYPDDEEDMSPPEEPEMEK